MNTERIDNLLDNSRRTPDLNVEMAHWAILVHYQPILNAELTVQLVAVVTLFGISAHFEADLAEQIIREGLINLEDRNRVRIIPYIELHRIVHSIVRMIVRSDYLLAG